MTAAKKTATKICMSFIARVAKKLDKSKPWNRPKPKGTGGGKLTPEQKEEARARAKAAGRPYPNLVDNMAVARKKK